MYLDSPRSLKTEASETLLCTSFGCYHEFDQHLRSSSDCTHHEKHVTKPKMGMHSGIIALCSMKDRQHIVLRWRQLESRRLRRHIGPTGRFEISASHKSMRSLFATCNTNLVPDHDQQVGAFWQTVLEDSIERSTEGSREGARKLSGWPFVAHH